MRNHTPSPNVFFQMNPAHIRYVFSRQDPQSRQAPAVQRSASLRGCSCTVARASWSGPRSLDRSSKYNVTRKKISVGLSVKSGTKKQQRTRKHREIMKIWPWSNDGCSASSLDDNPVLNYVTFPPPAAAGPSVKKPSVSRANWAAQMVVRLAASYLERTSSQAYLLYAIILLVDNELPKNDISFATSIFIHILLEFLPRCFDIALRYQKQHIFATRLRLKFHEPMNPQNGWQTPIQTHPCQVTARPNPSSAPNSRSAHHRLPWPAFQLSEPPCWHLEKSAMLKW